MVLIRRIHLYTGLLLVPWVMLYGVTAFLFNHPTVATDRERGSVEESLIAGTPLAEPVDAQVLAAAVAGALLGSTAVEGAHDLVGGPGPNAGTPVEASASLVAPSNARFTRDARIEVRGTTSSHSFSVDPARADVHRSSRRFEREPERPYDREDFAPEGLEAIVPLAAWKAAALELASEIDPSLSEGRARVRSGPTIAFELDLEGTPHEVRYDVGREEVTARPMEEERSMGWRSFLLRMHLAHTYPSDGGVRWLWAVLVDAMAFSMVSWALSGLIMWWQIKRTRRAGKWVVAVSVAGATAIGAAMYAAFVS